MKRKYEVDLEAYTRGRDNKFSDYEIELIENLITTFSKILGIKRKVMLADRETIINMVAKYYPKSNKKKNEFITHFFMGFAMNNPKKPAVIFLNPRLNICIKEIMDSTIHELVHIRYPKWSEDKVRKYMTTLIPRADKRPNICAVNRV